MVILAHARIARHRTEQHEIPRRRASGPAHPGRKLQFEGEFVLALADGETDHGVGAEDGRRGRVELGFAPASGQDAVYLFEELATVQRAGLSEARPAMNPLRPRPPGVPLRLRQFVPHLRQVLHVSPRRLLGDGARLLRRDLLAVELAEAVSAGDNPAPLAPLGNVCNFHAAAYWVRLASLAPSPTDQMRRSGLPWTPAGNSICTSVVLAKNLVGDSANIRNLTPPTSATSWLPSRVISTESYLPA